MRRMLSVACLIAMAMVAWSAQAAEKKMTTIAGVVQSVDTATSKIVVMDKDSNEKNIVMQEKRQVFKQEKADDSAVKDGQFVQVDGKGSEDGKTFTATRLTVYEPKGRGFTSFRDNRIDGTIEVRDGKWFAKAKDKEAEIVKGGKFTIVKRTWMDIKDIPTGANASAYGTQTDDGVSAYIITYWE